ncbi:MAG TPA: FecR domain-containing protein [Terriglobales bacterium]|nr:FecR domain-containing protein [Terriglobales bacterium]
MKLSWIKALGGFFLAALLTALPVSATNTALPGTLNFVEGQASIQNQPLSSKSVGSADLQPGQELTTENGRAEVLLMPGVFLRLDHNSAVKMISPELTNTKVQLEKGRAEIEVAEIHKQNNLQVLQDDASTQLRKTGLYDFSAGQDNIRVIKGEAMVTDGDKQVKVKGGHELTFNSPKLKAEKFDKDSLKNGDDFYAWSSLRDQYLSEASANAATIYVGPSWVGPGWYWDPAFFGYTFIPGGGVLYSPFGPWGFYSPGFIYSSGPYFGYGFYGAPIRWHRGFIGHPVTGVHPIRPGRPIAPHTFGHLGGPHLGAFHGSAGPGFHGGPGGFHH